MGLEEKYANRTGAEKARVSCPGAGDVALGRRVGRLRTVVGLCAAAGLAGLAAAAVAGPGPLTGRFELRPAAPPSVAGGSQLPLAFALDDGGIEGAFGLVDGGAARSFLWFNRFQPPPGPEAFEIDEVRVLFPGGAGIEIGAPIELVVYSDHDGDPATGARWLASFDAAIQAADDATFSVVALDPPVRLTAGSEVLIGVVDRFVASGVTPPLSPAALDTTAPAGRSWLAVWSGDPPAPPELPPVGFIGPIEAFLPAAAGNWMIRGFGRRLSVVEVPTVSGVGLGILACLLTIAAVAILHGRRRTIGAAVVTGIAVAAIAGATAVPAHAQLPFASGSTVLSAASPRTFAPADLDRDGDVDLVVPSFRAVSWLENDGAGTFVRHDVDVSDDISRALQVAVGDLDGDGDLDFAVAAMRNSHLTAPVVAGMLAWFENDGSQGFTRHVVGLDIGFFAVDAADLDGDGDLDLAACTHEGPATVAWYENDGGGGFTVRSLADDLSICQDLELVDLDRDGHIDVVAAGSNNAVVRWYENDGAGAFAPHDLVSSLFLATDIDVGDLDGDGDLDVAVGATSSTAVSWLENDGAQQFQLRVLRQIDGTPAQHAVSIADIDGDGDGDILAGRFAATDLGVFQNLGGGGFVFQPLPSSLLDSIAVDAADLDGDGDLEILASHFRDDVLRTYENLTIHRSATFEEGPAVSAETVDNTAQVFGDLDGDGRVEVVYTVADPGVFPPGSIVRAELDSRGLAWEVSTIQSGRRFLGAAVVDLDRDGDLDLATFDVDQQAIVWHENADGVAGSWNARTVVASSDQPENVAAADLDGDGAPDLLAAFRATGRIAVFANSAGDGSTWAEREVATGLGSLAAVTAADVDGDGDLDAFSASSSHDRLRWHENLAGDATAWQTHTVEASAVVPASVFAADMDRDGDVDLLATSLLEDRVAWYENLAGDGSAWAERTITTAADQVSSAVAFDFDADGDLDVLSASNLDNTVAWYENAGDALAWQRRVITDAAPFAREVRVADLDGDGDGDVLSHSYGDNMLRFFANRGGQFAFSVDDPGPFRAVSGQQGLLAPVTVHHRGRTGDSDIELVVVRLFFEDQDGAPLTSGGLATLASSFAIYRDEDGSATFDPAIDRLLATVDAPQLVDGFLALPLPDDIPALQVAHGAPVTYFAVATWRDDASAQGVDRLHVSHLDSAPWSAEDARFDLPLVLEPLTTSRITIEINQPPTAAPDLWTLPEDHLLRVGLPGVLLNDQDPDGDPLTAVLVAPPQEAAEFLLRADGSFDYRATEHWSGADAFTYQASDGVELSAPSTVTLEVAALADSPTLAVEPASAAGSAAVPLSISATLVDTDGSESLTVRVSGLPAGGALTAGTDLGAGTWQLVPAELAGLALILPASPPTAFDLGVTATATEASNGSEATVTAVLAVSVGTDLALAAAASVDPVVAGTGTGNLDQTLTVRNDGPFPATGIEIAVTSALPPGVVSERAAASAGAFDGTRWLLASLDAGATATLALTSTVGPSTPAGEDTILVAGTIEAVSEPDSEPGDEAAEIATSVVRRADLAVTKDDGTDAVAPGTTTDYLIEVSNLGPSDALGATVTDTFPPALTCSWTCMAGTGASCTAGPVAGDLADTVDLAAGAAATFTASCRVADDAVGPIVNTATIVPGEGDADDPFLGNNGDPDENAVRELDWADAPDAAADPPAAYPTTLLDDGARHGIVAGFHLGAAVDAEPDGLPSATADGDDLDTVEEVDDEDGVLALGAWVACEAAAVAVSASAPGLVDAWIDFDGDGTWDGEGEQILVSEPVAPETAPGQTLTLTVPCDAAPGDTFARFRLSSAGGLAPSGAAPDGEVEDHAMTIVGLDFGDAADPSFPTLFASDGARHALGGGPVLGLVADAEADGQPTADARGDDLHGIDDEDGVALVAPIVAGQPSAVEVTASAPGLVDAWIDFGGDGSWTESGDRVFTAQPVSAGANRLTFQVPPSAVSDAVVVTRFRLSTAGVAGFDGFAPDGEVEDVALATAAIADLSVVIDDGAASAVPGTPIVYTVTVANEGPDPARAASVTATLPPTIAGLTWTCAASVGSTCTAGPVTGPLADTVTVAPGGTLTYTLGGVIDSAATGAMVAIARVAVAADAFDPDPDDDVSIDSDELTPVADLALIKDDGVASAVPGLGVTYTLTVRNDGPSDAPGATVTDAFPPVLEGVSWTCAAPPGAACTAGPAAGDIADVVSLPAGSTVVYTATATVAADATGTLTNVASAAPPAGTIDPDPGDNQDDDVDTLEPTVDLAATLDDGADAAVPGTPIGYQLVVTNDGPSDAAGATVEWLQPATLSGIAWTCTASAGSQCTAGPVGGDLTDTVTVRAGGSLTYQIDADIDPGALGELVATARVAPPPGTSDSEPGNDLDEDVDTLTPETDLAIVKDDDVDPWHAGTPLVYTLTVTNVGPSDALDVLVTDVLPEPLSLVATRGCAEDPLGAPACTLGTVPAGASVAFALEVAVAPAPPISVTNVATVAGSHPDTEPGNDEDAETTTLDAVAPTVRSIAVADGPPVGDCASIRSAVRAFRIGFSEPMAQAPGAPGSIADSTSYRLVAAAPGAGFDTEACTDGPGGDLEVAVRGVEVGPAGQSATVHLAAGAATDGLHRLFVCGTVTDLAGNPLDVGGAGADHRVGFRIDRFNLLAGAHFDTFDPACDLDDWQSVDPGQLEVLPGDHQGSPLSGSVHGVNPALGVDLAQCVPIAGGGPLDLGARLTLETVPAGVTGLTQTTTFFAGPACTGAEVDRRIQAIVLVGPTGPWLPLASTVVAPPAAASARYRLTVEPAGADPLEVFLDALFLGNPPIFADGFESGDTSGWSATVP